MGREFLLIMAVTQISRARVSTSSNIGATSAMNATVAIIDSHQVNPNIKVSLNLHPEAAEVEGNTDLINLINV